MASSEAKTSSPSNEQGHGDKRRSSFFNFGGNKKDRKAEDSEGEAPGDSSKRQSKIGELFRRPSKAVKSVSGDKKDASGKKAGNPPAALQEDGEAQDPNKTTNTGASTGGDEAVMAENAKAAKTEESDSAARNDGVNDKQNGAAIGDVVPEAVTVGRADATSENTSSSAAPVSTAA